MNVEDYDSDQKRMEGKIVYPPYRPYSQGNPSLVNYF